MKNQEATDEISLLSEPETVSYFKTSSRLCEINFNTCSLMNVYKRAAKDTSKKTRIILDVSHDCIHFKTNVLVERARNRFGNRLILFAEYYSKAGRSKTEVFNEPLARLYDPFHLKGL